MSKHKSRPPRLRDIWINQTELGQYFGISAVAVGKKLIEAGLRTEQKEPTERAKTEGYCFLRELGSDIRLGPEETPSPASEPNKMSGSQQQE